MRSDLLQRIASIKEIENVIILTHNFDGIFVESLILPVLRRSGNPSMTIFADADCAIEAYESQRELLSGLGFRYRLVPVDIPHPFRFHPKAVLLSSRERATLFVGSGNLGFGGWRENGEIWAEYNIDEIDQTDAPAFAYFRTYLYQILDWVPISETVKHDIDEAFGGERKQWVAFLREAGLLFGRVAQGPSLTDQLQREITGGKVKRLWICSPYFDEQGEAIIKLSERFSAQETIVLLPKKNSNLSSKAASRIPSSCHLRSISFKGQSDDVFRFPHGKFYGIEFDNKVTAIFGSANCSNAAWFISGYGGNTELVGIHELPREAFEEAFLRELEISDLPPELDSGQKEEEEKDDEAKPQLKILAARFAWFAGVVKVGFKKGQDVSITECLVNDQPCDFHETDGNELVVKPSVKPVSIRLKGICPEGEILSNRIWVDHELELSASSKERSLVDTIYRNVRDGVWGLAAWIDIINLLQDHLDYLCPRGIAKAQQGGKNGEESPVIRFTRTEVFSKESGLFSDSKVSWDLPEGRLDGLRHLLLRWFGFGWEADENEARESETDYEEDVPDEIIKKKPPKEGGNIGEIRPSEQEIQQKEQRRAADLIRKIVNKISDLEYLKNRPPTLIAKDLGIIAILMTSALSEGWLSYHDYFEETHRIWRLAFFDDSELIPQSKEEGIGYLERLYRDSEDREGVQKSMATVDFAAALSAWALATQEESISPEQALLSLSQTIAVARLPWIWRLDAIDDLRQRIRQILVHTGFLGRSDEKRWERYCQQWDDMIRRGQALREFEKVFQNFTITDLKKRVKRNQIKRGEFLWQTAKGGFYVLRGDSKRNVAKNASVLKLKARQPVKMIRSDFLIPLLDLLDYLEENAITGVSKEVPAIIREYVQKSARVLTQTKLV